MSIRTIKESKVAQLTIRTFWFVIASTLTFFIVCPMVYSTKFIFENWYRFFPRRFNPRKSIFEGVDFRGAVYNEPGEMFSGEPLIDFALNKNSAQHFNFANFSKMDLKGKVFNHAYADSANFSGANLSKAKFLNIDLGFADFRGANLTGCAFISCPKIETAKFSDPKEKGLISGALCEIVCIANIASHYKFLGIINSFDIDNGMMVMLFDVSAKSFSFTSPATGEIFRDLPLWLIHGTFAAVASENNNEN